MPNSEIKSNTKNIKKEASVKKTEKKDTKTSKLSNIEKPDSIEKNEVTDNTLIQDSTENIKTEEGANDESKVFRSKFGTGDATHDYEAERTKYKPRSRKIESGNSGESGDAEKVERNYDNQYSKSPLNRYNKFPRRALDTRKVVIDYKKPDVLERFISKTGKMLPRRVTGATAAVQRKISREIKRARHIGLLPYSHR